LATLPLSGVTSGTRHDWVGDDDSEN
jgi:hypothetical protein